MDTYRKDIDGLRAFAVLPVVLFHAGYSFLSGGYVGVDIFFVISGYLITSIIYREINNNQFSILQFYERRIRRIYPAALAVALFTTIAAAMIIPPSLFKKVGWALVFMNLYSTNILFFKQAGYFDTDSTLNPFLHTWSLSVEEQFYLFFPLFLLAVTRLFKDKTFVLLFAATLFSFAASCYATYQWPTSAFYLIPFRAWELAIGSLLAIRGRAFMPAPKIAGLCSAIGLLCIFFSILAFNEDTPFPGFAALLPCIGAALLLYAGAVAGNPLNRFMGSQPLRYFGLISYSLYLWHWPIFVLARFLFPTGLSTTAQIAQIALAWICAHLSWRFIEAPFRHKTVFATRPQLFRFFAGSTAAMVLIGCAIVYANGFALRLPANSLRYENAALDNNPERAKCHGDDDKNISPEQYCVYGAKTATPTFALWGDSHGAELTPAIGSLLEHSQQSIKMFTYSQCPPALGFSTTTRHGCIAHNDKVIAYLQAHPEITTVFLIAHYRVYETGVYHTAFEAGFARSIAALKASTKKVIVIYPVPGAHYSIPLMASSLALRGSAIDTLTISKALYAEINSNTLAFLNGIEGVERLHPENVLCAGDSCRIAIDDHLLYFDNSHLNMFGARYVAGLMQNQIAPIASSPLVSTNSATLAADKVQ
ncbi:MAG TPA: acyltransferase family protein [Spongiibacteraceae bacterium]